RQEESEEHRRNAQQKEKDRIAVRAKRLAIWGKEYDNEALSRKEKKKEKHGREKKRGGQGTNRKKKREQLKRVFDEKKKKKAAL
ncbi:hypothetical protein F9883_18905, partial [Morganella morganii]|uniref:hypothetical protein n=1 Tax=Morganella morganii TaxID=582 RepID=UPI0019E3686C